MMNHFPVPYLTTRLDTFIVWDIMWHPQQLEGYSMAGQTVDLIYVVSYIHAVDSITEKLFANHLGRQF